MISTWVKHLKTPEEKADFEKYVIGSKQLLNRLYDIITEQEKNLDRSELTLEAYSQPNWPYAQAHKNGYRTALGIIKKLVTVDQPKDS